MAEETLVSRLEDLLDRAKSGEITGIQYTAFKKTTQSFGYFNASASDLSVASTIAQSQALESLTNNSKKTLDE